MHGNRARIIPSLTMAGTVKFKFNDYSQANSKRFLNAALTAFLKS